MPEIPIPSLVTEQTCLSCGSTSSDESVRRDRQERQLAALSRFVGHSHRDELRKLQASLDADEPVISAVEEVTELLRDEKHFVADVVDGVASVKLSQKYLDGQTVCVDVSSALVAVPLSLDWQHEFLCDGGFNRHVTAKIEFRLARVEQSRYGLFGGRTGPNTGMSRLFYAVTIRQ